MKYFEIQNSLDPKLQIFTIYFIGIPNILEVIAKIIAQKRSREFRNFGE